MGKPEQIQTLKANGHYSSAIKSGETIYVSGQFAVDPATGKRKFGTVQEETRQALQNIEMILQDAGSDRNHILKTTAYVCSMEDWAKVNEVYDEFFGDYRPSRTIVNAKELHFGFKVEIEAIATVK